MKKTVYNVYFYDTKGVEIEETQIDEKSEELAWSLFREFGHRRRKGTTIEFEKTTEN